MILFTMCGRLRATLYVASSLLVVSCLQPVGLEESPCPCSDEFKCCQRNGVCVRRDTRCPEELDFVLLSPNGGENWARGSTQIIRWQVGRSTGSIRIDFDGMCDDNSV
ncbi:MAG: hypothetical protein HYZ27_01200, partial [Deltaproteobacteria bacterium]|nr:hypothetical protein [Deltaproteobacteria bacterium]